MNINVLKLLLLLLPISLRNALNALCVAIATPWQRLNDSFRAWQHEARLDAATTWQVISLQHLLNERLLGTGLTGITIMDAPAGQPYDFMINIPAGVAFDTQLLNALVNKYKLYGKRFNVDGGIYTYSFTWSGFVAEQVQRTYIFYWNSFVAEQVERTYSFVWSGFVAEQVEGTYSFVWSGFVAEQYNRDNYAHISLNSGIADAWFDDTVYSTVYIGFSYTRNSDGGLDYGSIQVPAGSASSGMQTVDGYNAVLVSVSPVSDAKWDYLI